MKQQCGELWTLVEKVSQRGLASHHRRNIAGGPLIHLATCYWLYITSVPSISLVHYQCTVDNAYYSVPRYTCDHTIRSQSSSLSSICHSAFNNHKPPTAPSPLPLLAFRINTIKPCFHDNRIRLKPSPHTTLAFSKVQALLSVLQPQSLQHAHRIRFLHPSLASSPLCRRLHQRSYRLHLCRPLTSRIRSSWPCSSR